MSQSNLNPAEISRYQRQLSLACWGREAQERLKSSRILMAGAGGVASCSALYLIAAGLGALRLVDQQRVSFSDLHHQVLYRERDLGKPRAVVAQGRLNELNPFAKVESRVKPISGHNIYRLAQGVSLIVDARNQSGPRQVLNNSSIRLGIPLVCAQVEGLKGHLTTFWPGHGPCQACVSMDHQGKNGIEQERRPLLGPISGVLGALLALESLRILGGLGPALCGRVLTFDAKEFLFTETFIHSNSRCPACAGKFNRGA
jgi:adenylyltransferase/sulfurtransferase